MIFWILTVIIVLVAIGFIVHEFMEMGFGFGVAATFFVTLIAGIVWALMCLLLWFLASIQQPTGNVESRHELAALSDNSSVHGRSFFLGSGWVDEKRVIDFVEDEGEYSTLGRVDADDSRIYEDEGTNPYMIRTDYWFEAWWLVPEKTTTSTTYEFHIPDGSILGSYSIDNGGN